MWTTVEGPPSSPLRNGPETEISSGLPEQDVEQIAEIFSTPLTGAFSWNYQEADKKLAKLYRLGKERNWNVDLDVNWDRPVDHAQSPQLSTVQNPFLGWAPYEALDARRKLAFSWHLQSWRLSQFLHGEQGALLVASQLVSCAPSYEAKLYAASQTFDEARHVEAFSRYLSQRIGFSYPINRHLKALLDKILTDSRWDLKFVGMQLVIESLALAAFNVQRDTCADRVLYDVLDLIIRDEARHVAFGVNYLEDFVRSLTSQQREDRARFAFEACRVMRERIVPTDVFEHFGFEVEEARARFLGTAERGKFQKLLFGRIMPNLDRVGLITEQVKPLYDELGLLEFAGMPHDGAIDWANLSRPLPSLAC